MGHAARGAVSDTFVYGSFEFDKEKIYYHQPYAAVSVIKGIMLILKWMSHGNWLERWQQVEWNGRPRGLDIDIRVGWWVLACECSRDVDSHFEWLNRIH